MVIKNPHICSCKCHDDAYVYEGCEDCLCGREELHNRRVEAICTRVRYWYRALDKVFYSAPEEFGDVLSRTEYRSAIRGLLEGLCILQGWDLREAMHEGRADTFVRDWLDNHGW